MRQVFPGEIGDLGKGGDAIFVAAADRLLQPDPHHAGANLAAAGEERFIDEAGIGHQTGRRQCDLDGHILTAAQQVEHSHVLACLPLVVPVAAKLIENAVRTGAAGLTVADLSIEGLAQGRLVIIILAALRPVGVGVVAVENDTLQIRRIVRHIRVSGRDLKLQMTAAGDLDAGEAQAQALHIIRKIFAGEVIAVKELRDLECGLGLHHGIGLFVHNRVLLKNIPTAQAASSSV